MSVNRVLEIVQSLLQSLGEEPRRQVEAFVHSLRDEGRLSPSQIIERSQGLLNEESFRELKSLLYQHGVITGGQRSGLVRLRRDEDFESASPETAANTEPATSSGTVEVKRDKEDFMTDKLLAEVITYQTFAHYVFAAYHKPWESVFRPPEEDEFERMTLLQKHGIGVLWVTHQRQGAKLKNFRCVMAQNALRGEPSADHWSLILDTHGDALTDQDGKPLPDLRRAASIYFQQALIG